MKRGKHEHMEREIAHMRERGREDKHKEEEEITRSREETEERKTIRRRRDPKHSKPC